jgi:hypothetical protein
MMSPFYAPFDPKTDGLDVCSDCGTLVSKAARAVHEKAFHEKPQVVIEMPKREVIRSADPARTKWAQQRRDLFEKAERDGVLEQYRTPSGRTSYKWHCTVCGAQGGGPHADGDLPVGNWWVACAEGHPFGCTCGRRFATVNGQGVHIGAMGRNRPNESHKAVQVAA